MASFAPIRGTRAQIGTTPIVDGQFLVETNQGANNRIYLDTGSTRSIVGGGTGLLPHLTIELNSSSTAAPEVNFTVINPDGTSTTPVTYTSDISGECNLNGFGTYIIIIDFNTSVGSQSRFSKALNINDVGEYSITFNWISSTDYFWSLNGGNDVWTEINVLYNNKFTFNHLDPSLGYKLYFYFNDSDTSSSLPMPMPKWINMSRTFNNDGTINLEYTINGGINGNTEGVLRIIR